MKIMERMEGLNKFCGRTECGVTDPLLCWGCLGDENNDDMQEAENNE